MEGVVEEKFNEAWSLMTEKGLGLLEKMKVRDAIANWADSFPKNVEQKSHRGVGNDREVYYVSKHPKIANVGFKTAQECVLFNSLHELSPDTPKDKLIEVLKVVNSLLGVDSDYKF